MPQGRRAPRLSPWALAGWLGLGGFWFGAGAARGAPAPGIERAAPAADSVGAPLVVVDSAAVEVSAAVEDSAAVEARLEAGRGRWLLVNVWATWCRPCVQETPELVALAHSLSAQRLGVLGLSTDLMIADLPEARAQVEKYRRQFAVPYPLVLYSGSNDALTARFRLSGAIPATLLYDPTGREAGRWERRLSKADLARIRALVGR